MATLETKICDVEFQNPFILPSGILTGASSYRNAIKAGVGGVTLKSLTLKPRQGNPNPRIITYDCGVLNSVGLINPGIEKGAAETAEFFKDNPGVPVIVSLFSDKIKEFATMVEKIAPLKPAFIELNLSCPNVESEFGKPLGMDKEVVGKIITKAKSVSAGVPLLAKLTPNVNNIAEIAKACEAAGADGITAINTVGPGMVIDINHKKPKLGAKKGGISGPGILPVTVRCIYEIYEAVKIPVIGMGGVTKWQDVVEVIMAGASLVGVGSAIYTKSFGVYADLKKGLSNFLEKNNYSGLDDIKGIAHN